jgi:hypothetical protein
VATNIGELVWKVTGDTRDIDKSLKKTETGIGKVGKAFLAAFSAVAIIAGVKKLIGFLGEASDAAAVQESAIVRLGAALEATGQAGDNALSDMQSFASELQQLTVVGDEVTLGLLQTAINMGLTAEEAQNATQQAIGLSRAYGIGLDTALIGVTNTLQGQTSTLSRYIPSLKTAGDETERIAILNEEAARAWSVATAEVETAAGAQAQLENTLGDSMELIGDLVNERLTPWRNRLNEIVSELNDTAVAQRNLDAVLAGEAGDAVSAYADQLEKVERLTAFANGGAYGAGVAAIAAQLEQELAILEVLRQARADYFAERAAQRGAADIAARRAVDALATEEEAATLAARNALIEAERLATAEQFLATQSELAMAAMANAEQERDDLMSVAELQERNAQRRLDRIETERQAEEDFEAQRAQAIQNRLTNFSTYASSVAGIFSNLIAIQLAGDQELTEKQKKNVITLYRVQQAANIAQVTVDTATAIARQFKDLPIFLAIPAAIIAGAVGAAQIGLIAATPPPQMAQGGIVPARPGGTTVTLGEAGEDEIVTSERRMAEFMGGSNDRPIILQIDSEVLASWVQGQLDNRGIVVPKGTVV